MTSERELKDYFGNQPINCGLQRKPDEWTDSWRRRSCVYITTLSPQTAFFCTLIPGLFNFHFIILVSFVAFSTPGMSNIRLEGQTRATGWTTGCLIIGKVNKLSDMDFRCVASKFTSTNTGCDSTRVSVQGCRVSIKKKKLHRRRSFCHQGKYLSKARVHNKQSKIGRVDKSYWN